MIHALLPIALATGLVGLGVAGVLMRRNAILVLVGVELILSGALVLLVASGSLGGARYSVNSVLPLFVITIAAAETVVALAVIVAAFRARGRIDLDDPAPVPEPVPDPGQHSTNRWIVDTEPGQHSTNRWIVDTEPGQQSGVPTAGERP
ncbi:MAG TPA: NADH-quinone oxidoreductase subunit NuoK [Phycicoccus sp.]|nr:NADH-quinone oxidoreductase subunit NuoK [Phycicoccus sp.]